MPEKKLKLALPKGSLLEQTLKIFSSAGFEFIFTNRRSYTPAINDPEIECVLLRAQEIPRYVSKGMIDVGIAGDDWIGESEAKVKELASLEYSKKNVKKIKWVLAVSKKSDIKNLSDLEGKTIATELVKTVEKILKQRGVKARVEFSWGATEVKPGRFCDAIVELTETGSSIEANNLRIIETLFESGTKLITNESAYKNPWKREKMEDLAFLLAGSVEGRKNVMLMMHVPQDKLQETLKNLPETHPTIKKITGEPIYDVTLSVKNEEARTLIPKLKKMGCAEIVEFPINTSSK
ncbi:ATP phosphoribosyltransferase [Candidatus Jorgensenbacteria bacterium RIFCSPLOWO2_01_FULL_45_25b]|uniref:ATP phosphoribosyltransferase n=1 Tax=Candidatus Jorgensenbacteria bacterium RIFCSPLOWO2_01_FULL_45_25b TaxID=1798471 RepID=A0A1F6BTP9_9BACT|nr:MAG: ATP phosphoribosyltransferase [Candidatus Jorgensenbacteria bacterium RIFCSPLOWO2_01_FULL_45_25b]